MTRSNWKRGRQNASARCRCCLFKRAAHGHHVVFEQELKKRDLPLYDRRNRMDLCADCHLGFHKRSVKIGLVMLTDENLDFAFEALGSFAYDWLKRRYAGHDERLNERLQRAEEAA